MRARLDSAKSSKKSVRRRLVYLYDFGDGWEHMIKIERLTDPDPGVLIPA